MTSNLVTESLSHKKSAEEAEEEVHMNDEILTCLHACSALLGAYIAFPLPVLTLHPYLLEDAGNGNGGPLPFRIQVGCALHITEVWDVHLDMHQVRICLPTAYCADAV